MPSTDEETRLEAIGQRLKQKGRVQPRAKESRQINPLFSAALIGWL